MTNPKVASIVDNLKQFFQSAGKNKAVLGMSGGVDSALVGKIAVEALGKENVTALVLPNEGLNSPENVKDAEDWCKELGIEYYNVSINDYISQFGNLPWEASDIAKMNIQARSRANIIYHYANSKDAIVLGTSNKTETILGYFTKYGDAACDVRVVGNYYKTEVWEIAKELGIPKHIINKIPTAELAIGQTDEGEIGVKYTEIDEFLKKYEQSGKPETENEKKLYERIQANKHKEDMPPAI